MAPVLDKKSHGVHQYQLRIHQWNAKGIHRELPLKEDQFEATNVDVVSIQEMKLQPKDKIPELRNFSAVRHDRPVQGEANRGRPYDLHPKTYSLQNHSPTGHQLKRDGETED